jgi:hypothetical protein
MWSRAVQHLSSKPWESIIGKFDEGRDRRRQAVMASILDDEALLADGRLEWRSTAVVPAERPPRFAGAI